MASDNRIQSGILGDIRPVDEARSDHSAHRETGAGNALRSTLPLGRSGSVLSATNCVGTMYVGRRCCRNCRSA